MSIKIAHVQYDGSGQWLDVEFSNGLKVRFPTQKLYNLLGAGIEREDNNGKTDGDPNAAADQDFD